MSDSNSWETPQWLFDELNVEFNFDIDLCAIEGNSKCDLYCPDYLEDKVLAKGENLGIYLKAHFQYGQVKTAFMNPPYSNPKPFIEKAWEDSKYCRIVCLVKCDPSTKWWATFWDYDVECTSCYEYPENYTGRQIAYHICSKCKGAGSYNGPKPGCTVRFFPKRIKFDAPEGAICDGWGCHGDGVAGHTLEGGEIVEHTCHKCKGTGEKKQSGPTFASALVIMDRREL